MEQQNLITKIYIITNWGKLVLQIGATLFYYKLGQTLLQIGAASLLQIRASVVTNWGSYYKLGQPLLQNRAAITNWGKIYYKLGHNSANIMRVALIGSYSRIYHTEFCQNPNTYLKTCQTSKTQSAFTCSKLKIEALEQGRRSGIFI